MATDEQRTLFERLSAIAEEAGATRAAVIPTALVETDASYRALCSANTCGNYGNCWTCPPFAGDIHDLMAEVPTYGFALVYQTVGELEDSYDYEGMMETGERHNRMMLRLRDLLDREGLPRLLHLGAGGCRICPVCAKKTDEPCRHPDKAVSSLETYGVNVAALAEAAGMKYINGQNTVTFFGAVLFDAPAAGCGSDRNE